MRVESNLDPLEDIIDAWLVWFDEAMPEADAESFRKKFKEESEEFLDEPSLEEVADCFATLVAWMNQSGYNITQFKTAFVEKLWKNRLRTFELQDDGTYHHVKVEK